MTLMKWTPKNPQTDRAYGTLDAMIQDLLSTPWAGDADPAAGWVPPTDVVEADSHYTVKLDLPGMTRDDIKISLQNGTLSVTGSRNREAAEAEVGYSRIERRSGSFTRTFQVPNSIDAKRIEAVYKDGVLTLTLPKSEESRPREIEVRVQ